MAGALRKPLEDQTILYPGKDIYANKLNGLEQIGDEEIRQYWQQGFLAVENVLNKDEINDAIQAIDDIIHKRVSGPKLMYDFDYLNQFKMDVESKYRKEGDLTTPEERELALRKISEYVEFDERLKAIAYKRELMEVLQSIVGEKARLIQDMAILKPPGGGGAEKPWHQDMAYGPLAYDKPVIGIWIAMDEATVDNGCMHVIPGSHAEGGVPHYAVRDWQICDTSVPVSRDVVVPLKPGGVLFFHGMLIHGTPANKSKMKRRALQMHYVADSSDKIGSREYKRIYTNEMSNAEC